MLWTLIVAQEMFSLNESFMFSSFSESDVKQLWLQLRKDEPHLLSNFEEFLVRIFSQLQEADNEKNELEYALKKLVLLFFGLFA